MYLVFNGNDHTVYNNPFKVFHSFNKALDYASDLVNEFSDVDYTNGFVKTWLKEAYESSKTTFGIHRGTFYYRNNSDMFDESYIGIEWINVGDDEGVNMFDYSNIINLTPHAIDILEKHDGNTYTRIVAIPASGKLARLTQETVQVSNIGDIPITSTKFGEIEGLPDYDASGTKKYIVSYHIAKRLKELGDTRDDIFITNESVRDSTGTIIGCLSLAIV